MDYYNFTHFSFDEDTKQFAESLSYLIPIPETDNEPEFTYWLEIDLIGRFRVWEVDQEIKCKSKSFNDDIYNKRMFLFNNYFVVSADSAFSISEILQYCNSSNGAFERVQISSVKALSSLSKEVLRDCFVSFI